jgi:halimadienyl-diphosphate synthase
MSTVAYDTAWIARLGEIDEELSQRALAWLCEHQLPDGSWGVPQPYYYHDRLISTLAAMIALTYRGRRSQDRLQIERGLLALEAITGDVADRLRSDSNGPTVGFEMIVPTLVAEAESLGLIQRQGEKILGRLNEERRIKLSLLKGKLVNRRITAAFSAEMAGQDGQHMLDIENLQEANGSVGHSPSATAYFSLYVRPGDQAALRYLRTTADPRGGAPDLHPFDIFEAAWVLWNFSLIGSWDDATQALFQPLLERLKLGWKIGEGIGLSIGYSVPDGDDTSFVYEVLSRFGEPPDIQTVLAFEEKENFRTYQFEATSSNSINIHALGALRQAGFDLSSSPVQKILSYLMRTRVENAYWFDKWNLSPYYTTAHAIIAGAGFADEIMRPAVEWILRTQNPNGAWGYHFPSAEETAYCIQALEIWRQHGGRVTKDVITRAANWLQEHSEPPYRPLWIGKGLYAPELVVRSAILSALLIAQTG